MPMDPFLILTPILILAIMALVRFVGCLSLPPYPTVQLLDAVSGDQTITLSWMLDTESISFKVKRGTAHGGPYPVVASFPNTSAGITSYTDTGLSNGTQYFYVMTDTGRYGDESNNSNEVSATPIADVTVTFDTPPPPGTPGSPLNGVYKNLDFEIADSGWIWVDAALGMGPANSANINSGPNPGQADSTFVNGARILRRIRVFPKAVGNVTITDTGTAPQNPQVAVAYQTGDLNMTHFIETGWTVATQRFTIAADIGFNLLIDTIAYQGPA